MPEVVLVTAAEFRKAEPLFRAPGAFDVRPAPADEEPLARLVSQCGARAVAVGVERYRGALYEALSAAGGGQGAILARFGVGHDNIDKALARKLGIVVTNTPGVLDASVAEHAIWLAGALARHVAALDAAFRAGCFTPQTGSELRGRTLGVLGLGHIGQRVAAMARFGFGMRVLGVGLPTAEELARAQGKSVADMQAALGLEHYACDAGFLLRESDVVSLHLAVTPDTRHFINAQRLSQMKPGALLVNTARGAVVDEEALYDALAAGSLGGAALDVFENEPYRPVRPEKDLRRLPNVVLTPHVGSNTHEANRRMAESCLANIGHFFAGRLDRLSRVDATAGP